MKVILDFLKLVPVPIQIAIASLIIGGTAVAGLETRYMTVSDFTKSYVLDLKTAIRAAKKDLKSPDLTDREREMYEEELAEMIDELCYETDDRDRLCVD